jgi:hypothetical protein
MTSQANPLSSKENLKNMRGVKVSIFISQNCLNALPVLPKGIQAILKNVAIATSLRKLLVE